MIFETKDTYSAAAQEDRCAPRTQLSIPSSLRPSGARSFKTIVHDLSLSGFSATAITRIQTGQFCWLTLPGLGSLQSEVVWWEGRVVGCAFQHLLSPIVLENILSKYRT